MQALTALGTLAHRLGYATDIERSEPRPLAKGRGKGSRRKTKTQNIQRLVEDELETHGIAYRKVSVLSHALVLEALAGRPEVKRLRINRLAPKDESGVSLAPDESVDIALRPDALAAAPEILAALGKGPIVAYEALGLQAEPRVENADTLVIDYSLDLGQANPSFRSELCPVCEAVLELLVASPGAWASAAEPLEDVPISFDGAHVPQPSGPVIDAFISGQRGCGKDAFKGILSRTFRSSVGDRAHAVRRIQTQTRTAAITIHSLELDVKALLRGLPPAKRLAYALALAPALKWLVVSLAAIAIATAFALPAEAQLFVAAAALALAGAAWACWERWVAKRTVTMVVYLTDGERFLPDVATRSVEIGGLVREVAATRAGRATKSGVLLLPVFAAHQLLDVRQAL